MTDDTRIMKENTQEGSFNPCLHPIRKVSRGLLIVLAVTPAWKIHSVKPIKIPNLSFIGTFPVYELLCVYRTQSV